MTMQAAADLTPVVTDDPSIEALFEDVARALDAELAAGERYTEWFEAESSDFVRMNRGKVRQAGRVRQQSIAVRLIRGTRHAEHALSLTGNAAHAAGPGGVHSPPASAFPAGAFRQDPGLRTAGQPRTANAAAQCADVAGGWGARGAQTEPRSLPRCPHCGWAALFLVRVVPPLRFKAGPAIADTS